MQLIRWDTLNDIFEYGQWFHGRIYENCSDLSPDGSLFVYFTAKYNRRLFGEEHPPAENGLVSYYTTNWTAVSRPPWLTALALWPEGDSYGGGGFFRDNRTLDLYSFYPVVHKDHQPSGLTVNYMGFKTVLYTSVYTRQLQANGWVVLQEGKFDQKDEKDEAYIRAKSHKDKELTILNTYDKVNHKKQEATRGYRFSVKNDLTQNQYSLPDNVTWADWDQQGRLVFAGAGQLFADTSGTGENPILLADFNPQVPYTIESPSWAKEWPQEKL